MYSRRDLNPPLTGLKPDASSRWATGAKRRWRDLNPHVDISACLLSRQIPSPVWVHLRKTPTPGLEPGHPLKDYSRFSKPLPCQLGLCRQLRHRQDLNLHVLSDCLFSGQVLHQLSDCGKRCLRDSNLFILTDGLRFPTGHLANSVKTACSTPDRI